MKKIIALLSLALGVLPQANAQNNNLQERIDALAPKLFSVEEVFSIKLTPTSISERLKPYVSKFTLLSINNSVLASIATHKPIALEITIPLHVNSAPVTLQLIQSRVVTDRTVFTTSTKETAPYTPGAYYSGIIKNQPNTVVAMSFFNDNIIGIIANENGNYVVGKMNAYENENPNYIIYNDKDLLIKNNFTCGTVDNIEYKKPTNPLPTLPLTATHNKCIWVYVEADHQLFLDNGSDITKTINFATGLFNVTTTLFEKESINTSLSEVKVWDTPSRYDTTTTLQSMYNEFEKAIDEKIEINGNLAHLLSGKDLGGGKGFQPVSPFTFCFFDKKYRKALSTGLTKKTEPLPTYSWNVNVVAHEMGHNLGSSHTQACVWKGTNSAIDSCVPTEGGCPGPGDPPGGGTIMSYCHTTGVGINFANGFGKEPGDTIRSNVQRATCLESCAPGCNYSTIIDKPISGSAKYEANKTITASSSVTTKTGESVIFDAGTRIELAPGFKTNTSAGGSFRAYIDGCGDPVTSSGTSSARLAKEIIQTKDDVSSLLQAYPDPFTNKLAITFTLTDSNQAMIEVYSITGIKTAIPLNYTRMTSGTHTLEWDTNGLSSGIYVIILTTDTHRIIRKIIKL